MKITNTTVSVVSIIAFFAFCFFYHIVYEYTLDAVISQKHDTTSGSVIYWSLTRSRGLIAYMDIEYRVEGKKYVRQIPFVYDISLEHKFKVEYNSYFPSLSRVIVPKGCLLKEKGVIYYKYVDSTRIKTDTTIYLY